MSSKRRKAREIALKALYQIDLIGNPPEDSFVSVMVEEVYRPSLEPFIADFVAKNLQGSDAEEAGKLADSLTLEVLSPEHACAAKAELPELTREKIQALLHKGGMKTETVEAFCKRIAEKRQANAAILGFARDLVTRTTENLKKIDDILEKFAAHWSLDRMATLDRAILRFSVCELLFFREIPINVTINEAVELSKKFSTERSREFVNGILDKIQHEFKPGKDDPRHAAAASTSVKAESET